jgi:hypothetical protein
MTDQHGNTTRSATLSPVVTAVDLDLGPDAVGKPIPCTYCRTAIKAGSFVFRSAAQRVLSAPCPGCHRQVSLSSAAWHRWSGSA